MFTLGINAAFHDSSAALVKDGVILAAAEEERFTHIKHGKRPIPFSAYELPYHAIDYCLKEAEINLREVDHIAYAYDPSLRLNGELDEGFIKLPLELDNHQKVKDWDNPYDPLFISYILNAPGHLIDGVPLHLKKRFNGFKKDNPFKWHFVPHHLAHAASSFLPSPYEKAAILTLDGRGEIATTTFSIGKGHDIRFIGQVDFPHSLGLLYEKITQHLGFLHSSDEYKVMALASFGNPKYLNQFRSIIHINGDGSYAIAPLKLDEWFGPAREKSEEFKQKHYDIAASLQKVLEESALKLANWLYEQTKEDNLCIAGGVGLNCVMNSKIKDEGPFKNIWIQPAAGDAGTALGAAMWIDANTKKYVMETAYLGPSFTDKEIEQFIKWAKLAFIKLKDPAKEVAQLLAKDKIIGWFQGRMEFGPRALGNRSILASPINPKIQERLNEIKDREDFRPVAPVVLEEEAHKWFKNAKYSPFMLFVYDILPHKAEKIPAVRHVDGTARIQTINRKQNLLYYNLIKEFSKITGVPILVNTSFNTRGEPIVCTPRDAIECFWTSPLDYLVIGSYLLKKN